MKRVLLFGLVHLRAKVDPLDPRLRYTVCGLRYFLDGTVRHAVIEANPKCPECFP